MEQIALTISLVNRGPKSIEQFIAAIKNRLKGISVTQEGLTVVINGIKPNDLWELIYQMQVVKGCLKEAETVMYGVYSDHQILKHLLLNKNGLAESPQSLDLKSTMIRFLLDSETVDFIHGYFHGASGAIHDLYAVKAKGEIRLVSNVDCGPDLFWMLSYSHDSIGRLNGRLYSQLAADAKGLDRLKIDAALQRAGWPVDAAK